MKELKEKSDAFLGHFAQLEEGINGDRKGWVHALRKTAIDRYRELGLPARKHEEWRYLNLAPLLQRPFRWAGASVLPEVTPPQLAPYAIPGLASPRLVFLNGQFVAKLSSVEGLPAGVQAGSLAEALRGPSDELREYLARGLALEENPFCALNTGFITDGAYLRIPRGSVIEAPIHLLCVAVGGDDASVSHPRNLVVLEPHAKASIVEHHVSLAGDDAIYFTNAVSEVHVAQNARLEWLDIQQESRGAFHIASLNAHQEKDSSLRHHSIALGGRMARKDINVRLDGTGIESHLYGFYLASGKQQVDHHTLMEHLKPHGQSWEIYKGVLDDEAQGVFNGKIHVHQEAQKTDAKQTNKNLLLSDGAVINTKPQLRIYADDVKCTHGATIGRLDLDALYYLRCRGIGEAGARRMLTHAFAGEVIDEIQHDLLREFVSAWVEHGMSQCRGLGRELGRADLDSQRA